MTPVTLVLPYYENPLMLMEQYTRLRALPEDIREFMHVIIVDDGSPNNPARLGTIGMPLQIYRIKVDVRWNQDAARNIGVKHADTKFILMTDMDHIIPEETWWALVNGDWRDDFVWTFERKTLVSMNPDVLERYKSHPNTWFMSRKLYERIGGYDERLAGFYGTDGDFKMRTLAKAKGHIELPRPIYRVPREVIPDASTTTYQRKESFDRPSVYKILKEREANGSVPIRHRFPYERVA